MKTCSKCKIEKNKNEFDKTTSNPDGLFYCCKSCRVEKSRSDYLKRKEVIKARTSSYYYANKDKIRETKKKYQKKMMNDPKNVLVRRLRNRLYYALQKKSWAKNTEFSKYIGCSLEELKAHIESKFADNMSWENQGDWHIDHIVPLISAKTPEEMYKLCHYTNLQPMWAKDNLSKGSKFIV